MGEPFLISKQNSCVYCAMGDKFLFSGSELHQAGGPQKPTLQIARDRGHDHRINNLLTMDIAALTRTNYPSFICNLMRDLGEMQCRKLVVIHSQFFLFLV